MLLVVSSYIRKRRGNNFTSLVVFLQLASDTKIIISHATRVITVVKTTNLFTIVAHIVNTLGAKSLCRDQQSILILGKEWYIYRNRALIKYPEVFIKQCKVYMYILTREMLSRVSFSLNAQQLRSLPACVCVCARWRVGVVILPKGREIMEKS